MKTITCSDRIYYDELLPEEAQAIRQDIQLVHSILHKMCIRDRIYALVNPEKF